MRAILNAVGFDRDELKEINGCFVCGILDGVNDEGTEFVQLSFYNPATEKYIQMRFGEGGSVYISEPFNEKG